MSDGVFPSLDLIGNDRWLIHDPLYGQEGGGGCTSHENVYKVSGKTWKIQVTKMHYLVLILETKIDAGVRLVAYSFMGSEGMLD